MNVGEVVKLTNFAAFDGETDEPVIISGDYTIDEIDLGDPSVGIFGSTVYLMPLIHRHDEDYGFYADPEDLWLHIDPEGFETAESWDEKHNGAMTNEG